MLSVQVQLFEGVSMGLGRLWEGGLEEFRRYIIYVARWWRVGEWHEQVVKYREQKILIGKINIRAGISSRSLKMWLYRIFLSLTISLYARILTLPQSRTLRRQAVNLKAILM
jgi:hypothetical protein